MLHDWACDFEKWREVDRLKKMSENKQSLNLISIRAFFHEPTKKEESATKTFIFD